MITKSCEIHPSPAAPGVHSWGCDEYQEAVLAVTRADVLTGPDHDYGQ